MTDRILGSIVELQRGSSYKSKLLGEVGPKLLGLGSIAKNGGFKQSNLKSYSGPTDPRHLLYPGDIYVSLKDLTQSGDLLGSIARVPPDIDLGRLTQDTVKLIVKDNDFNINYLYWSLRTPQYRTYCRAHALGTTNLSLSRDDFFSFKLPPFNEDRSNLVQTLEKIEAKIDLNQKMSATLEAMAHTLYRSWFVAFDPVHARSQSLQPDHMDTNTAALFPDRFGEDGFPVGWEVTSIGEVAQIVGGGTPKSSEPAYWEGGLHLWATPKDLSKLGQPVLFDTARKVTDAGLAKISSRLSPAGTLLLSSRAPIGYLAIAARPVTVNQGFIAIRETEKISRLEAYFWCVENMDLIHANANGSTFQEISKKNFRPIQYALPPKPIRDAFNEQAGAFFERLSLLCQENHTLATLRDTLLSRLMSGELRIGDAHEQVEEML